MEKIGARRLNNYLQKLFDAGQYEFYIRACSAHLLIHCFASLAVAGFYQSDT